MNTIKVRICPECGEYMKIKVHNALEYWVCENGHFVEKLKRGCIPLVIGIWEDC